VFIYSIYGGIVGLAIGLAVAHAALLVLPPDPSNLNINIIGAGIVVIECLVGGFVMGRLIGSDK
jgi:hypothetical protein